jgi:hypothetical protein
MEEMTLPMEEEKALMVMVALGPSLGVVMVKVV